MRVGFAVPTRGMHPHLERLKDLYSEFGPVLILDPTTRYQERYAAWVNQGIRWAKAKDLDALIWSNDDIGPTHQARTAQRQQLRIARPRANQVDMTGQRPGTEAGKIGQTHRPPIVSVLC